MAISENAKKSFLDESKHKNIYITCEDIGQSFYNADVEQETMQLSESIMDSSNVEIVGCIASQFKIKVHNYEYEMRGSQLVVEMTTDDYPQEPLMLFQGVINSCERQANRSVREVIAYDFLYELGNTDVAEWYNSLWSETVKSMTLKQFRDSLWNYLITLEGHQTWRISQENTTLVNDDIVITQKKVRNQLKALNVIKSICQVNGVFGKMGRDRVFRYINPTYSQNIVDIDYYKAIKYQDYTTRAINKVTVRDNSTDNGVVAGTGQNNYIVQGNMFVKGQTDAVKQTIANRIYSQVSNFSFIPYQAENSSIPYLECGVDRLKYSVKEYSSESGGYVDSTLTVPFMNRKINGIQSLMDKSEAQGSITQDTFISDAGVNLEDLEDRVSNNEDEIDIIHTDIKGINTTLGSYGGRITNLENGTFWKVKSVAALPTTPETNTLYIVQGEVFTR